MTDLVNDVLNFQQKVLGNQYPQKPALMTGDKKNQNIIKMTEEINEFEEATTIADQADAIVDMIYFGLGVLHQMGVDTYKVWDAVHHANMTKKRGLTKRGFEDDAAKPDDWKAPDHSWLDEAAQ